MPRPKLPNPVRRPGSESYYIRPRINGRVRWRSLHTADQREALKRVPAAYQQLLDEFDSAEVKADEASAPTAPKAPMMTVEAACAAYRDYLLECEHGARREFAQGGVDDHSALARSIRGRLEYVLRSARQKAVTYDFDHQVWWLAWLRNKGVGHVEPTTGNLLAVARAGIAAYVEILEADDTILGGEVSPATAVRLNDTPKGQKLSEVAEAYIAANGGKFTENVKVDIRGVVRDVVELVGDKAVTDYTRADGKLVREVLTALPGNRHKRAALRGLSIREAVEKGREQGLEPQAPKTIQIKRAYLSRVFAFAAAEHDGVFDPFAANEAWKAVGEAAADQRDAFTADELKVLMSATLPGHMYWLTWLGLCTGARLNELCQLTGDLVRAEPVPNILFAPTLKLKTAKKSGSSVRSVPLHPALVDRGFVDYAARVGSGLLFPGIPVRKLTGRLSDAPSKDFIRLLASIGLRRKGLSFHSLRHTFAAEFKRRHPRDVESRERLLGHHVPGVAGRYGASYLNEANDADLLVERAKLVDALKFDI